ncbi:acyltransferase [Candidatus Nitrosotenuis cloacae]|uniref:Acetyltransferase n=1 Tax=Candidatus Nitrosotenuis cloacae TaxID=1603555 RepID=A0A3G1B7Q9_9ARCH|nr:acyltransferase [Candidatus Nitrosotenuis cloacae]AJZ76145.1 acetyltransferase [Candidatus Nitrosotenuis cloacae]
MKDIEMDAFSVNEQEIMQYYGYSGTCGRFQLRCKFLKTWILHTIAHSTPFSGFAIKLQRSRGVKIGKKCHFSPYVLIDLLYPQLVTIGDNVTIGSNTLIFAHTNPTTNLFLKKNGYPRKVESVNIKSGAVLFPGCIVTAGVTIGENSLIGAGSVVFENVPDYCVVVGNPARIVKRIEH